MQHLQEGLEPPDPFEEEEEATEVCTAMGSGNLLQLPQDLEQGLQCRQEY